MVSELGLEGLFDQVSDALGRRVNKKLRGRLARRVAAKIREDAGPVLKTRLLSAYDELTAQERGEFGPAVAGKDPSALENFRDVFEAQITKEIARTRVQGETIVMEIGEKDAWGLGRSEPPRGSASTVDFLGYYIEGVIGEFGFITIDQYKEKRGEVSSLGRFGRGFLISRSSYERERWEETTGLSFEDVKHPISGQSPYNGFNKAVEGFDFSPYVSEAVQEVFSELGKSLV